MMSKCEECKQQIFDRAEALVDAIDTASGCNGALLFLLDQLAHQMPQTIGQANSLIRATDRYLTDARDEADRIARLTMGPP